MISHCRYVLTLLNDWMLHHILREANFCANALANHGRKLQLQFTVFETLPLILSLLFLHDLVSLGVDKRKQKSLRDKSP